MVRRIGEDGYHIKGGPKHFREQHEGQLLAYEPDVPGKHVSPDYTAHEADSDDDNAEQDDYTVKKILAQRPSASAPGAGESMVRWAFYGPSSDTSGPLSSFALRIDTPFMEYTRRHRTKSQVSDLEDLSKEIEAMGD